MLLGFDSRFLHMCDYRLEDPLLPGDRKLSVQCRQDICAILAHASAYFMDVYSQCAGMQAGRNLVNVVLGMSLTSVNSQHRLQRLGTFWRR